MFVCWSLVTCLLIIIANKLLLEKILESKFVQPVGFFESVELLQALAQAPTTVWQTIQQFCNSLF